MYDSSPERIEDYKPARKNLTSFAVITILLMVITITIAIWCMLNFNKGLKQYVYDKPSRSSSDDKPYENDLEMRPESAGRTGGSQPGRMVID